MKSLRYKISQGYLVIICINLTIAAFAIYHIHQLSSPVDRILREKYQNVSIAETMALALRQQEFTLLALQENPQDSSLVTRFETYKNEFLNWHQRAIEGISLPEEPVVLDSITQLYQRFLMQTDRFKNTLKTQSPAQRHWAQISQLQNRLHHLTARLKELNTAAIAAADANARGVADRAMLVILVIAGFVIFLSIAASLWLNRSILKPLKETTETVRQIGQGNLNLKIEISTDDEIAALGREFNKMTERLHAYEQMNIQQLLQEKKKSETIVAGIPAAIIVTDDQNRLALMNDRAQNLLNTVKNDWQNQPLEKVIMHDELRRILSRQSVESPSEVQNTLVLLENKGQTMYFAIRQIEMTNQQGEFWGKVTLLQDVTSFKNLDRLKTEFMATISHEFKTPLTSLNMTIDILLNEVRGQLNEQQRQLLSDAKLDGQRLRTLVTDLLDLSRMESGNYPLHKTAIDLPVLLENALQPLRFAIREKKIRLNATFPATEPRLQGDFQQLSRVLTNLIENAIQHSPSSGEIKIDIQLSGNVLHFGITDEGPGIPEEAIDLIFDKFVQVKNFQNAEAGNIGLGLAIAREVIHAHSGTIAVESEPGKGACFQFTLPLAIATADETLKEKR